MLLFKITKNMIFSCVLYNILPLYIIDNASSYYFFNVLFHVYYKKTGILAQLFCGVCGEEHS